MRFTPSLAIGLAAPILALLSSCAPQGPAGQSSLVSPAANRTVVLRVAPDPQSLIGVTPQAVEQQLGIPGFDGTDGEARIWRYSGSTCSLLVVFYPQEDGTMKSAHLDARQLEGGAAPVEPCLRQVVNAPST